MNTPFVESDMSRRTIICVALLNYRTPELICDCLDSLVASLDPATRKMTRLVVVDNASGDESVDTISHWLQGNQEQCEAELVQCAHNGGFAAGINAGINAVDADYYLLMNSDTLTHAGAVESLLAAATTAPSIGIFAPRLEWPSGEVQHSCFRLMSPISEFLGAASWGVLDRLLSRRRVAMDLTSVDQGISPEWVSFAVVMIRREVLSAVGGLDESFFMYFEDAEFCARAEAAGWGIEYVPDARFVHLRGGSSSVKSRTAEKQRLPRYYYESRARYFRLVYGPLGPLAANLAWLAGRCLSAPRQWLGREDKRMPAAQWRDIWINCFRPLRPYTHPERVNDAP